MLGEIMDDLALSKADLVKELGVHPKTLDKLLVDGEKDNWRLDREALYRYLLFAHAHGFDAFRIAPHPIWRTFENDQNIRIFRGSNKADGPVEVFLTNYLERLHGMTLASTESDGIEKAMKQHNCVIIGSPKANAASEIALALLWGAQPFVAAPQNQDQVPVHFLGMKQEHPQPSAILIDSSRHGIDVRIPKSLRRNFVKVDWLPSGKYEPSTKDGQEAAVLVACHRPLGTEKDVTTIIIAGYTGTSTLEAAHEVTYKKIPDLDPSIAPGEPCFAVLKFIFRKRAQRRASSRSLRSPKEGTAIWGPPWEGFFQ
ncbi:MAG: hypothetical protein ACJ76Y_32065 [Thermoanaerobaculia bacterium]